MWQCPTCGKSYRDEIEGPCFECGTSRPEKSQSLTGDGRAATSAAHAVADSWASSEYPKYDPLVIRIYAKSLYDQALWIIIWHVVAGLFVGAVTGCLVAFALAMVMMMPMFGIAGAIVGLIMGIGLGNSKALILKLQAQLALCQVEIEKGIRELKEPAIP